MIEQLCNQHSGLCAQIDSLEGRIRDLVRLLDLQITNMEKAVNVAKDTLNLRLESMNEFREQLNDQTKSFITRTELNVHIDKLELKLDTVEKSINEKFTLVLKPIMEKLTTMETFYNRKVGGRVWEVAIVSSCLSLVGLMLMRYIFKF